MRRLRSDAFFLADHHHLHRHIRIRAGDRERDAGVTVERPHIEGLRLDADVRRVRRIDDSGKRAASDGGKRIAAAVVARLLDVRDVEACSPKSGGDLTNGERERHRALVGLEVDYGAVAVRVARGLETGYSRLGLNIRENHGSIF